MPGFSVVLGTFFLFHFRAYLRSLLFDWDARPLICLFANGYRKGQDRLGLFWFHEHLLT